MSYEDIKLKQDDPLRYRRDVNLRYKPRDERWDPRRESILDEWMRFVG